MYNDENYLYKLDNAGKIYPSIVTTRISTVFRISIKLGEKVDKEVLQKALDIVSPRFPYFKVNLHRGLFWYYFEYTKKMPKVEEEKYYPCMYLLYRKKKTFPFRVLYYKNYIKVEFSHSICDGTGANIFAKTLLVQYFRMKKGIICNDLKDSIDITSKVMKEEFEDAFYKYYKKNIPKPLKSKEAIHLPFKLMEKGKYILLTGIAPTNKIKDISKEYGCTITQLITAIYMESIQEYILANNDKESKKLGRIVINMPVNLRRLYFSNTLKNFFISITPEIDLRLGGYTREEIIEYLKSYMKMSITTKNIDKLISRNVKNERFLLIKIIPLWFKNIIMPIIYNKYGEKGYTSSVSNLGIMTIPHEIEEFVEGYEIFPPPSQGNKIKLCVLSFKENLYLCFGKTTNNTELERIFFRKIRKLGVPIKIETNMR